MVLQTMEGQWVRQKADSQPADMAPIGVEMITPYKSASLALACAGTKVRSETCTTRGRHSLAPMQGIRHRVTLSLRPGKIGLLSIRNFVDITYGMRSLLRPNTRKGIWNDIPRHL